MDDSLEMELLRGSLDTFNLLLFFFDFFPSNSIRAAFCKIVKSYFYAMVYPYRVDERDLHARFNPPWTNGARLSAYLFNQVKAKFLRCGRKLWFACRRRFPSVRDGAPPFMNGRGGKGGIVSLEGANGSINSSRF